MIVLDPESLAPGPVSELRFDAGSLALNLVATVGRRYGEPVERLDSLGRLAEWLDGVGLDVRERLCEDDLDVARALREDLNELFRSVLEHRRPHTSALNRVNSAAAATTPQLRAGVRGGALMRADPGERVLGPVLALTAGDAIRIVCSRERANLRCCESEDCRMVYLATGRRTRRWCSSERCGNRARVASHRSRAAVDH